MYPIIKLEGGHIEEAAPDSGRREATDREARDDVEIAGPASDGALEVGVGQYGGYSDESGNKDNFVAEDIKPHYTEAEEREGKTASLYLYIKSGTDDNRWSCWRGSLGTTRHRS